MLRARREDQKAQEARGVGMAALLQRRAWSRVPSGRAVVRAFGRATAGGMVRFVLLCLLSAGLVWLVVVMWKHGRYCDTRVPASNTVVCERESGSNKRPADLRVVVLTHSRAVSLLRLLRSAASARYDGDRVDLEVWVDRSAGTEAVDETVVAVACGFRWLHGSKAVHVWDRHVGIWGQWMDSYRPLEGTAGGDTRAVLLEDDVEVSRQYYRWLRGARAAYGGRTDVFGYTLQRGTLRANGTGFGRRGLRVGREEKAFLYPLVGSWGYAPEPQVWAEFRTWFHEMSCRRGFRPYVEGLTPTKWYKKQEARRTMWTMWHIRYAAERGLYTVYANLGGGQTLAANWREPGLHFRIGGGRKGAGAVTRERDFALLGEEGENSEESRGVFEFPSEPRLLAWNGTFVGRDGIRTTV